MPAPALLPTLGFVDGDFTVAATVGKPRFSCPFNGDNTAYQLEQDYMVWADFYSALSLVDGSGNPRLHPVYNASQGYRDYYFVAESPLQDLGGGVARFTRTWCAVPAQRLDFESFASQLPGLGIGGTNPYILLDKHFVNQTVTEALGSTQVTKVTTVDSGGNPIAHGYVANDFITIYYRATIANGFEQQFIFTGQVFDVPSASTFRFVNAFVYVVQNIRFINVVKTGPGPSQYGRKPISKVVRSKLQMDYFLPKVTTGINTTDDIPVIDVEVIVDLFNQQTDTYTQQTTPTQSTYVNRIGTTPPTYIVGESSVLRRWKGNIYERATRYIIAQ